MSAPTYTVEQLVRVEVRGNFALAKAWLLDGRSRLPHLRQNSGGTVDDAWVTIECSPADAPAVLAWLDAQGVQRG